VANDGVPLTKDQQRHLFEPFFTTEAQGTGLGLYLSRELCEANRAQLSYELHPTCLNAYPQFAGAFMIRLPEMIPSASLPVGAPSLVSATQTGARVG
jgi:signal transduction histidine kinase